MRFLIGLGIFVALTSVMLFVLAWADTRHLDQGDAAHRGEFNVVLFKPDGQLDGVYNAVANEAVYSATQLMPIHAEGSWHQDGARYDYHRNIEQGKTVLTVTVTDDDSKHVSVYNVGAAGVVPQTTYMRSFDYLFAAMAWALGLTLLLSILLAIRYKVSK